MIQHIIKVSMEYGWRITIIYQTGSKITKRDIKVLEVNGDKIKAFCFLRNQIRYFTVENILSACYRSNESYAGMNKTVANM